MVSVRIDRGEREDGTVPEHDLTFPTLGGGLQSRRWDGPSAMQEVEAGVLTGKDNRAEGESLNVLGWVSPIAGGLSVVEVAQAQGNRSSCHFLLVVPPRRSHPGGQSPPLKDDSAPAIP